MRRIVKVASNEGDTIWEPFGGLCTASVAAVETGRNAFAAPHFSSLTASDQLANSSMISCFCKCNAMAMDVPKPQRQELPEGALKELVNNVSDALNALPAYFQTATRIEGLDGGGLFNLSAVLGSAIEVQVVETLNRTREVWDPENRWPCHRFVRLAQTFPDVRLVADNRDIDPRIALGIELKGWYLLSKEGEPSFRYTLTPSACAPQDLLVVVPWHLKTSCLESLWWRVLS